MAKELVVRLKTPSGLSRITVPATGTFADLQEQVKLKTGVEPAQQRLATDPAGKQCLAGQSNTPLPNLGIVNGIQLHLVNTEASIAAQVLTKVPVPVEPEQPVARGGTSAGAKPAGYSKDESKDKSGGASSSSGAASKPPEPAGSQGDGTKKLDPKFETFDAFLRNRRYDTAALTGNQRYVNSRVTQSGMIKIPPSVSIKQQPYRHVDYLAVMNVPELQEFIGYWQNQLLENAMQRMGWIYGYYQDDKNYDEGTRGVLEAIYEPPQEMMGEFASPNEDPHRARVDRIAKALGLERVGWIFTTLLLEDMQLLSPNEVGRCARLQMEHTTTAHFTKYPLSKFVSCAVRPDPEQDGNPNMNPFMVSDQCVAMVRDGLLTDNADRLNCVCREAAKDELIPDFVVEGKPNKKIDPDFFVVRVNTGRPKKVRSLFTHADFPRENRPTNPQRRDDLKKYFKSRDKSEPSWSRFADFHLLLYIAQEIDVDTAEAICECVRERKDIPEGVNMMINQLIQ